MQRISAGTGRSKWRKGQSSGEQNGSWCVCVGVSCSRERDEQGDFRRAAGALRAMVWSLDYILRAIRSSGKFRQGSGVITSYYEDVDF